MEYVRVCTEIPAQLRDELAAIADAQGVDLALVVANAVITYALAARAQAFSERVQHGALFGGAVAVMVPDDGADVDVGDASDPLRDGYTEVVP